MSHALRPLKIKGTTFEIRDFDHLSTPSTELQMPYLGLRMLPIYPIFPPQDVKMMSDLCDEVSWVWSPVGSSGAQPPDDGKTTGTSPWKSSMLKPVLIDIQ